MVTDIQDKLLNLGREVAMDRLNEHGNKSCPDCGHSNWAHGVNGCVALRTDTPSESDSRSYFGGCFCKKGKSNEEIIFGK